MARSSCGPSCVRMASAHAASAFFIHFVAWLRLSGSESSSLELESPRNSGDTDRSRSSEKRSIARNTFEIDVPPLNTSSFASAERNKTPSIHDTQKSFSSITGDTPRRPAASSM